MPTDRQLDARLRQMARASLDRDASAVDSHADLADLQSRLADGPHFVTPPAIRFGAGRWLAAAAATVLVIGGVAAIAWTRATDDGAAIAPGPDDSAVAPQPIESAPDTRDDGAASTTVPPSSSTSAPAPSTTIIDGAVAEPATVRAGQSVTITPAGTIERACDFLVRTTRQDGSTAGQVGAISPGSWSAGEPVQIAEPNCAGVDMVTDEPLTVAIPRNMPAGTYELCLTTNRDLAGCARVTIERLPDEATAEPATVSAGDVVTITPAGVIQRACQEVVTAIPLGNATGVGGQLVGGQWLPAGPITQVTYPPCQGEVSDAAVQVVLPADMPPEVYAICLVEQASYAVQASSDPGCAVVTVTPAPLPACWTEPVAPPTLSDGAAPGAPIVEAGSAMWGDPDSTAVVSQTLGREPNSWWLDESPEGVLQVSSGSVRAAVVTSGDWSGAPRIILVRGNDGCDREYVVGPLPIEEAVALAQDWVDALALAEDQP